MQLTLEEGFFAAFEAGVLAIECAELAGEVPTSSTTPGADDGAFQLPTRHTCAVRSTRCVVSNFFLEYFACCVSGIVV